MPDITTTIKITKATLKGSALVLDYDQIIENPDDGPVINSFNMKGGHRAHPDLVNAFKRVRVHLALICEQVSENNGIVSIKKKQPGELLSILRSLPNMEAYTVTGFVIGGDDEHEGVTLIGQRKLSDGSPLNLISPFKKWASDYKHADDFEVEMGVVIQECLEYLNGKYAPYKQLELELDKTTASGENNATGNHPKEKDA